MWLAILSLFNLWIRKQAISSCKCATDPTAPVPSVINKIRTSLDFSNSLKILLLLLAGICPWMRQYRSLLASSIRVTMSKVVFQNENTMLLVVSQAQ
jgi:hypothetical protein